jgi:hypothetical protein
MTGKVLPANRTITAAVATSTKHRHILLPQSIFSIHNNYSIMQRPIRQQQRCNLGAFLFLVASLLTRPCTAFSLSMAAATPKGCAAKPLDKKKVAVFGAGGYLGGCIYGFLQRAGSLYGTGISGKGGSPRAIVATSVGSVNLNGILSKNFILAQADESFVKLTNMASVEYVQTRLSGFDAAILGTRCTLEQRPVTAGTYEKTPNDKTFEFYMEKPRSSTVKGLDDPDFSVEIFRNALKASKAEGLRHLVVIETDLQFDGSNTPGTKYLDMLEESGIAFTYIRPVGKFENQQDYTYARGLGGDLKITQASSVEEFVSSSGSIYREDVAAVAVQALMSLDWSDSRVLQVQQTGNFGMKSDVKAVPQREWCMNSQAVGESLAGVA